MAETLDYGRRSPRRRWVVRVAAGLLVAAALLAVGPPVYRHVDQVMLERRAIRASVWNDGPWRISAAADPPVPIGRTRLAGENVLGGATVGVLDLRRGDVRRRVALSVFDQRLLSSMIPAPPNFQQLKLTVATFEPPSLFGESAAPLTSGSLLISYNATPAALAYTPATRPADERFHLLGVDPDPADPSRAVIRLDLFGDEVTVDLFLRNDGSVTLERREKE